MLFFAIVFVVFAFVLYTIAIWAHVLARKLEIEMLVLFGLALACDLVGTYGMSTLSDGVDWTLHGILGIAALCLMIITFAALCVAYRKQGKVERAVRMVAVYSWALWLLCLMMPWL